MQRLGGFETEHMLSTLRNSMFFSFPIELQNSDNKNWVDCAQGKPRSGENYFPDLKIDRFYQT